MDAHLGIFFLCLPVLVLVSSDLVLFPLRMIFAIVDFDITVQLAIGRWVYPSALSSIIAMSATFGQSGGFWFIYHCIFRMGQGVSGDMLLKKLGICPRLSKYLIPMHGY